MLNKASIKIESKLENVSMVRVMVASFLSRTNITLDELSDIKTAVSEAVTNSIEHGYNLESAGEVEVIIKLGKLDDMTYFWVQVIDQGVGIESIELATTPTYTTKPELEHAGMGFTIMETFMDEVVIDSKVNEGTSVIMTKKLKTIKA
ncbi:MAG: anti-sigma F factor [Clostridia bacterium]|nr:anti-sigma F factor [Clostridia bacterium]